MFIIFKKFFFHLKFVLRKPNAVFAVRSICALNKFSKKGTHIVIACFPKSGSTFLKTIIQKMSGFKSVKLVYDYDRKEQDIYYPNLVDIYCQNIVSYQHMKANKSNIDMLNEFSIEPIILVRNIFDVVVSIRDHFYNESTIGPSAYVDSSYFKLSDKNQYDFIIELIVPWYINFYVSWFYAKKDKLIKTHWVTYENFISDREGFVCNILDIFNIKYDPQHINNLLREVKNENVRFNKGVVGRGDKFLSLEQKNKIVAYKNFYPDVDFSMIGL